MFDETNGSGETTNLGNANNDAFLDGLGDDVNVVESPEPTEVDESGDFMGEETAFDEDPGADEAEAEEAPAAPADYEFPIKYRGQEQTVTRTREQLITDIQKAMDYDAVKKERDELRANAGKTQDHEKILGYLAEQNGMPIEDLVAYYAGQMSDEGQMSALREEFPDTPDAALKAILEARKAQRANEEAKAAEAAEAAHMDELFEEVKREYPDFDPENLPEDVANLIEQGMTPLDAMIRHELSALRKEKAEALAKAAEEKKKNENRQRSTGGYRSVGSAGGRDPFKEGLFGGG